jgi:hypothetical protein
MFRLITKRGVIQNHIKTKNISVDFRINTLDVECRWQHKCEDLEKNDDIIIVGYIGDDEYNDPILYGCAYFNISKNIKSSSKRQSLYWLGGLIIAILSIVVIYWKILKNEYMFIVLIFLFVAFISFFLALNSIAYQILEKEIKILYQKK